MAVQKNLRFGVYPYAYARVSVMKSKLIPKPEYQKLIKMEINEITRYLEESEYKKQIDELAMEYKGAELLEYALYRNLSDTMQKLKKITAGSALVVMQEYLRRDDLWNIKTILRGKHAGLSPDAIRKYLVPVGDLPLDKLEDLLGKNTVREALESLEKLNLDYLKEGLDVYEKTRNLALLENMLDLAYYRDLVSFTKSLPQEGRFFADFILTEVDFLNIKNLIKLKLANFDANDIRQHIIFSGRRIREEMLNDLISTEDVNTLISGLEEGPYRDMLAPGIQTFKKSMSLAELDLIIDRYLLKQADFLSNAFPLSVNVIIGYMFAKETEIKNLQKIIKSKQLGMPESFIAEQIVAG